VDEPIFDDDIDEPESEVGESAASAPITLKLTSDACGERLDKVIARLVPQFSRSRLQQWIDAGFVSIDGQTARAKMTVLGDETVCIQPQAAPEDQAFKPEPMELSVVHEDAAIIVLNKPAGLVVHPAAGNWSGTLLNGLLHRYPALSGVPRAGIVHRLDKDTSGLMVVAKTLEAHTDLVRQLQARSVKREYLALVWGTPKSEGTVDASIGRHPRDRIKMAVSENMSAKPAVTHYQRVATGSLEERPVSLMRCSLETGRTHQIRVHMASIGFPLVGDTLYGKPHLATVFPRQALQACRLGLVHPVSGKQCEWEVALAADFSELLARAKINL
jgi:23S rRNA pseudouridine1911/1915/1917 synthase